MTRYRALQAFPLQHPGNPKRQILIRSGQEVELSDDQVGKHAIGVSITPVDESGELAREEPEAPVELPSRPSNNATKDTWRSYLVALNNATREDLDSDLEVPDNATRDEMIALGDARVAEWNALEED